MLQKFRPAGKTWGRVTIRNSLCHKANELSLDREPGSQSPVAGAIWEGFRKTEMRRPQKASGVSKDREKQRQHFWVEGKAIAKPQCFLVPQVAPELRVRVREGLKILKVGLGSSDGIREPSQRLYVALYREEEMRAFSWIVTWGWTKSTKVGGLEDSHLHISHPEARVGNR